MKYYLSIFTKRFCNALLSFQVFDWLIIDLYNLNLKFAFYRLTIRRIELPKIFPITCSILKLFDYTIFSFIFLILEQYRQTKINITCNAWL